MPLPLRPSTGPRASKWQIRTEPPGICADAKGGGVFIALHNNSNGGNLANTGQSVRLVSAIATLVIIGAGYAIKRAGINSRN